MDDAPGADSSFDELFPPEGSESAAPPQAQPQETTPPEPPQANTPFLQAGKSVYLTPEDAAKGVAHKDELIDRYRTFLAEQGFDPNTFQPKASAQPQAPPKVEQSPYTYFGNGQKLYDDLAQAVASKDPVRYERVMQQYQTESFNAHLAPVAPLISEVARNRAIREVSHELPEFAKFADSQDFYSTVDKLPVLKTGIAACEQNITVPGAAEQLRELYKLAYLVNQGLRGSVPVQTPPAPIPPARPTTLPSTMTPPAPGVPTQNWATNREARKQLIKDAEARGLGVVDWSSLGK